MENLSPVVQSNWAKLEAERSLYKSCVLQWLILLVVGHYFKVGSTYLALVWLVLPAFAYRLLEATLSSSRAPKALKTITLLMGLFVPFLISGGMIIRLAGTVIGIVVRFDRNPGGSPEWLGSVIVAVYISAVICLTLSYVLGEIPSFKDRITIVRQLWDLTEDVLVLIEPGSPNGSNIMSQVRSHILWTEKRCGQGSTDDELSPTCVSSLLGIRIDSVAAGLWHTICISGDGDVYAFGGNQFGQLGTGTDQAETLPRLLDAPCLENEHARVVSCGARHSAVVTDGKVFCWGWNKYGPLGLGDVIGHKIPAQVALEGCVPRVVACGWWHTLLLAESPT